MKTLSSSYLGLSLVALVKSAISTVSYGILKTYVAKGLNLKDLTSIVLSWYAEK